MQGRASVDQKSLVFSTTEMRLEQTVAMIEWLMVNEPDDDSLQRVLELVRTALITLRNLDSAG